MIKQDILEKQVKPTYLAIGSNLGDKIANIEYAKNLLLYNNIFIHDSSSYYETPSWPNRIFPKFFNVVIKINTQLSLVDLFKTVKKIEKIDTAVSGVTTDFGNIRCEKKYYPPDFKK